jgi:hypothetical protein
LGRDQGLAGRPLRPQALNAGTPPALWRGAVDPGRVAAWRAALDGHAGGSLPLAGRIDPAEIAAALAPRLATQAWDLVVSQCWVRRARPPHHWHQDGALRATFAGGEALLPIVTVWLALTDCGIDAPGLEWVEPPLETLLPPAALTPEAVRACHAPEDFVHPALHAGDAVCFGGGLLHRTHVTPAMAQSRTSVELRFVPRGLRPHRMAGETFRPIA